MSHCDLVLAALRDGQWKTTATLYRDIGQPLILHSRISDLRHKGHNVEGRSVPGKTGADGYEYRLVDPLEMLRFVEVRQPVDAFSPDRVPAAGQLALLVAPSHYDI